MEKEMSPPKIAGDVLTIYVSHASVPNTGEARLVEAVLEDALVWAVRPLLGERKRKEIILECRRWIDDDDSTWPFCFINCCHVLNVEPENLRRHVHRRIAERENLHVPPLLILEK